MNNKEYVSGNNTGEGKDIFDDDLELELKSPNDKVPAVKVFVKEEVINGVSSYAKTDTSRELGGVLLGRYKEDSGTYRVQIEEIVIAQHTEAALSQVTFTHDTWEYIHHEMEDKYPDLKMVGWFHTHPGFGIFLSEDDYFIHKNFFPKPWSVAYVMDPIKRQDGFFGWENGNIIKIPERYVNEVPKKDGIKKAEPDKQPAYTSRSVKTKGLQESTLQKIIRKLVIITLPISLMANIYFILLLTDFSFFIGTNNENEIADADISNAKQNEEQKEENEEIINETIQERDETIGKLEKMINERDETNSETPEEGEAETGLDEDPGTNNSSDPENNHN